ncbi:L-lactate dehydrogenase [Gryllus bimaculatus]|nr:L-lactate dehydrogenase [Gryllus bimaculatus]
MKSTILSAQIRRMRRKESNHLSVSADSQLVVVAAGARQKKDESRLALVQRNADIFKGLIPELVKHSPNCILLCIKDLKQSFSPNFRLDITLVKTIHTLLSKRLKDELNYETKICNHPDYSKYYCISNLKLFHNNLAICGLEEITVCQYYLPIIWLFVCFGSLLEN